MYTFTTYKHKHTHYVHKTPQINMNTHYVHIHSRLRETHTLGTHIQHFNRNAHIMYTYTTNQWKDTHYVHIHQRLTYTEKLYTHTSHEYQKHTYYVHIHHRSTETQGIVFKYCKDFSYDLVYLCF